jgi:hypothetical protein
MDALVTTWGSLRLWQNPNAKEAEARREFAGKSPFGCFFQGLFRNSQTRAVAATMTGSQLGKGK